MTDKTLTATPVHTRPLPDRFQASYGPMTGFDPFHRDAFLDVKVTAAKDGYVLLSVALPEGMTRSFVTFLDAMHGLMRCADQQAVRAVRDNRPVDVQEIEQTELRIESFRSTICTLFDDLTRQGLTAADAVKRINSQLKADGHPWAGHEVVRSTLSQAGKFRRNPPGIRRRR